MLTELLKLVVFSNPSVIRRQYKMSLSEKIVDYTKTGKMLYVAEDKAIMQVYQSDMPFCIST